MTEAEQHFFKAKLQVVHLAKELLMSIASAGSTLSENTVAGVFALAEEFDRRANEFMKPPTILAPPPQELRVTEFGKKQ